MGSNRSSKAIFDFMRSAGVEVRVYGDPLRQNPLDLNRRWHQKHLVVDGRVAVEGGMNIADEYAFGGSGRRVFRGNKEGTRPWRDTDVRLEGPVVHDIQAAFLRNWEALGGKLSAEERARLLPSSTEQPSGTTVRFVERRVGDSSGDPVQQLYVAAIRAAKASITIETAYFLPPRAIREALVEAAREGVTVRIMTNAAESSDMGFVAEAARAFYAELIAAGVLIYEKKGGTLHAKTATFDGVFSIIGSANMNGRSANFDSEGVAAIDGVATAQELEGRFTTGLRDAAPVSALEIATTHPLRQLRSWGYSLLAFTF
jgi:cardiolipin synthase